jgi:hypothetical protein
VDDQQDRFDLVINALAKESLCTVLDLITNPLEDDPYKQLKERLCGSHQRTDCQQEGKLHQMDGNLLFIVMLLLC